MYLLPLSSPSPTPSHFPSQQGDMAKPGCLWHVAKGRLRYGYFQFGCHTIIYTSVTCMYHWVTVRHRPHYPSQCGNKEFLSHRLKEVNRHYNRKRHGQNSYGAMDTPPWSIVVPHVSVALASRLTRSEHRPIHRKVSLPSLLRLCVGGNWSMFLSYISPSPSLSLSLSLSLWMKCPRVKILKMKCLCV